MRKDPETVIYICACAELRHTYKDGTPSDPTEEDGATIGYINIDGEYEDFCNEPNWMVPVWRK